MVRKKCDLIIILLHYTLYNVNPTPQGSAEILSALGIKYIYLIIDPYIIVRYKLKTLNIINLLMYQMQHKVGCTMYAARVEHQYTKHL